MRSILFGVMLALAAGAPYAETTSKSRAKKQSSSAGASAPSAAEKEEAARERASRDLAYRSYDLDRDGEVSKAEAAGHEYLIVGFDRADRDRNGKLSRGEYDRLLSAKARSEAKAAQAKVKAAP